MASKQWRIMRDSDEMAEPLENLAEARAAFVEMLNAEERDAYDCDDDFAAHELADLRIAFEGSALLSESFTGRAGMFSYSLTYGERPEPRERRASSR